MWAQGAINLHKPKKSVGIGNKMVHKWSHGKRHIHMIHHGLDLGGVLTTFSFIIYFMIGNMDCIEMAKICETSNGSFIFLTTLQVHNSCIFQFINFQEKWHNLWKYFSNTILHVAIGGHLMIFSLVLMVSNKKCEFHSHPLFWLLNSC